MIDTFFQIGGSLGIFLYGMKLMSEGIQKSSGERLKKALNLMTVNRFTAVSTGLLVTALIQSSSATTVMVVGFVNAGLFSLTQAVGVILGANIGTTMTGWIVAVVGFQFDISAVAMPALAVSIPFLFVSKWGKQHFGEFLLGFGLLFLGLMLLKDSVPDIGDRPEMLEFLRHYTGKGLFSFLLFVLTGTIVTILIQSSSAAMAITLTMAYTGWIDFPTAACLVLGENIGTTITAYLASLNANVNARRAARAHTLFNLIGVLWMALLFRPFLDLVRLIIPETPGNEGVIIATRLALFHSLFNITNTIFFLPFLRPFTRLVTFLVKARPGEDTERYRFAYSEQGIRQSPEVNIFKAEIELKKMAIVKEEAFLRSIQAILAEPREVRGHIEAAMSRVSLVGVMHEEISRFLVHCSRANAPRKSLERINLLIRISNEIDNIGESCRKLTICAHRKAEDDIDFDSAGNEQIRSYAELVKKFLDFNHQHLGKVLSARELREAEKFEDAIDESRDLMRGAAQNRLSSGGPQVKIEILFIDILRHIEHVGDHSYEIARCLYRMNARRETVLPALSPEI